MRPVIAGCLTLAELVTCRELTLDHVALMCDALDVYAENERRAHDEDR